MFGEGPLQFGFRLPAQKPIRDVIATVRHAEEAGFDAAWLPDSHLNYREVWTTLSAVAVSTDRIALGPTVTNLVTRHPTVTASAARALGELAPGRFFLGLGAGDSAVGFDGLGHVGAKRMREGVRAIRALLAGESVQYGTFAAELRDADVRVPILVAASGPHMLRAAGAVGDAAIVTMGSLEAKLEQIEAGAREAGRDGRPPVFIYSTSALTDDVATTSRLMKPFCVRVAQLEGVEIFERAGVPIRIPDHTAGAEGDVGHAADLATAARELDAMVSDEAALWFAQSRSFVGTEAEIGERFDYVAGLGIAGVTLNNLSGTDLPDALIDALGPVIERWRNAR
jgi:5,10-methylenetetrahydromethanopterin reductase